MIPILLIIILITNGMYKKFKISPTPGILVFFEKAKTNCVYSDNILLLLLFIIHVVNLLACVWCWIEIVFFFNLKNIYLKLIFFIILDILMCYIKNNLKNIKIVF
jgi:hypothetical protein